MSEYQRVHFVACDRVLDDEQLAFMSEQSSRAEVTRRGFDNEYHFGDFRGDVGEMLRRGYDAFLHFADFGIRRVVFRLPAPPLPRSLLVAFDALGSVQWHPDDEEHAPSGPGLLELQPADTDAGTYEHDWDLDPSEAIAALPAVRDALLRGDPRPLYLGFLAGAWFDTPEPEDFDDEEDSLPPVPAGLADLPPALTALADFFSIRPARIAAAAESGPDAAPPGETDARAAAEAFAATLPEPDLRALAAELLLGDPAAVAARLRQRQRGAAPGPAWPLADDPRTLTDLLARADEIADAQAARAQEAELVREREAQARAAEAHTRDVERARQHPEWRLAQIEETIGQRTAATYRQNFKDLSVLHEALGPTAARPVFAQLTTRLEARDKRPVGLLKMMREASWID